MEIVISRQEFSKNISAAKRKYCLDCRLFFEPASLKEDPHATHYSLFLPSHPSDFDRWLQRIRDRDESVWGFIMDEDGVTSHAYCPPEFTVRLED